MAGAAPNQQEQMRKDYIKAFKDYSLTGDSSVLESLLPKGMFGGGYVPNQYGAPMNLNSTVASEMANFGAMQNDSANNLKTTVANANALHGATQTLSELKPGIVTTSPVTGTMSGILNSVFSKTPGASAMFGTRVDAVTLNTMRQQLVDSGADEKTASAAISTDKDGKLTMNNDAMISSFATAKKNILNKTYEQLAGGMTGDYQDTLRNAPQNANTATAASIVNGTQQQLRGLFNNLTVNNGIDINGQQVKSGDAALNSFVVRVDKDGNKTVYPISALIQDAPVKSGGSMESLTETVKDAVKTGEYMSAAAAQKWAKTPEGQNAFNQIKNNVGVTSNTPDVPDTTTGNMTSAGKVKTNSWLDNIINSK
jgi:hypothetical protein